MMKNLLSLFVACILLSANVLLAQPTNLDLENWTGNEPDGWATFNPIAQFGGPLTVIKETANPGEGTASAKIITADCPICPQLGASDTLYGILSLGTLNTSNLTFEGVPYTAKPVSVSFKYISNPVSDDQNIVFIQLSHWNGSQTDVVAQGLFAIGTAQANWTDTTITLQYNPSVTDNPDTLMIIAAASGSAVLGSQFGSAPNGIKGSEFFVDAFVIFDPCDGFSVSISTTDESAPTANDGTATATITGGTSAFSYAWSNTAQTIETITGLDGGVYTVTVTDDIGCIATASGTVNTVGCTGFSVSVSGTNETSFGGNNGTATATATGGTTNYSYVWSNTSQTTANITGLAPGTYDVTVTDNIGCTAFGSYTVLAFVCNLSASATKTNETVAGANDGTATVTASGGTTPYTYNWNNGETTAAIDSLPPVNYSVTVTDANNCTATASVIIVAGSVGINNLNSTSLITVFPNPASNNISFSITDKNADRIVIIDVTGKVINNIRVANSFINISVATYPEGMYFYQVTGKNSGNISTGKFSVVK